MDSSECLFGSNGAAGNRFIGELYVAMSEQLE